MASSIGFKALFRAHLSSLGSQADSSHAHGRFATILLIYGAPVALGATVALFGVDLREVSDVTLQAFSLFSAILMTVFIQFSNWSDRLEKRAPSRFQSEAATRRTVRAATYACLVGVILSAMATIPSLLLLLDCDPFGISSAALATLSTATLILVGLMVLYAFRTFQDTIDPYLNSRDDEGRYNSRTSQE